MRKKNIVFINMEPPYKLTAETLMLAAPSTTQSIQQVLVYDTELHVRDLFSKKSNKDDDDADNWSEETTLELCSESFDKIFNNAHTVIIPDALFSERSKIFKTTAFIEHGMQSLGRFYKNGGGRVIIICMEGVSNAADNINTLFETSWKLQYFESFTTIVPTPLARHLFGPFVSQHYHVKNMPYFISCPLGEGLFQQLLNDKETFIKNFHAEDETFERLGIEKDESLDCFNVEKSWTNYIKKYTDRYCIALHVDDNDNKNNENQGGDGGGQVVWFGDRGQSDGLAFIFCKLFILDQILEQQQVQQPNNAKMVSIKANGNAYNNTRDIVDDDDDETALLFTKNGPSITLWFSMLVALLALAARYLLGL